MKHNKIIVILMAIALLIGTFISAAAAGRYAIPLNGDEETVTPPLQEAPATPHVGVTGLLVGTEYFELSLKVSAREFQTVGVVLSYNTEVLTPIVWSSGEKNGDGTPKAISIDPESNNSWNRPVVLPSRGADGLAGKPALSYLGYDQEQQRQTGRGYLYLGADTLQYGDLIGERVVTVRFRRETGTEITMPEDPETDDVMDEAFTVCLASADIAQQAIPGYPVLLTAQGEDRLPTSYTHYQHIRIADAGVAAAQDTAETAEGDAEPDSTEEPGATEEPAPTPETDCTLSFSFGDVESADSTGGSSGDYAITFFDWDGRVIDAIAAPENAVEAVETWQSSATIDARLTNKAGYTFDKWLVVYENNDGEGLHTEFGSLTSRRHISIDDGKLKDGSENATDEEGNDRFDTEGNPIKADDVAHFEDLSQYVSEGAPAKSVLVQAAYKTDGETINGGASDVASDTALENPDFNKDATRYQWGELSYYQYGPSLDANNGSYGVRGTIFRNNVLRADTPVIEAQVLTTTGSVTVKLELENTDTAEFEVVVPKNTTRVTLYFRDAYGVADWTSATSRSVDQKAEKATIIREGAFATLVDEALTAWKNGNQYSASSPVNTVMFSDAGYSAINTAAKVEAAKQKLLTATAAKKAALTRAEVTAAIQGI